MDIKKDKQLLNGTDLIAATPSLVSQEAKKDPSLKTKLVTCCKCQARVFKEHAWVDDFGWYCAACLNHYGIPRFGLHAPEILKK